MLMDERQYAKIEAVGLLPSWLSELGAPPWRLILNWPFRFQVKV
jgi:hypothetical protein